jgi:hypothetical protein
MKLDDSVVALKGFDLALSLPEGFNPTRSSNSRSQRSYIWHLILNRCFPDIGIIVLTQFPAWRVDHQLYFFILDSIHDIRTAFVYLINGFGMDTIFC